MKTRLLFPCGVVALFVALPCALQGQAPVIASLGHDGQLVCTNLAPGSLATVEWAPSLDGPWTNTWVAGDGAEVDANGVIRLTVSRFYRVRVAEATTVAANPDTPAAHDITTRMPVEIVHNANGNLVCNMLEPGSTATVEWGPSRWGPWTNTWSGLDAVVTDSSGTIRVPVPLYYRVMGIPLDPGQTNLAWIPAGAYMMGSPDTEPARYHHESPQTEITISRGFWMGKHEVTQGEYEAVMGHNPSGFAGDPNLPVETVSWNDATNYCARLTERERLAGRLPVEYSYRLPTEAEWEYACRAGTTTPFHYGDELRSGMANFNGRYEYPPCGGNTYYCYNPGGIWVGRTMAVGSYAPSAWGLHDMHGNVEEWCLDRWADSLPGGSVIDPTGPGSGSYRVYRGGGWHYYALYCRSAARNWYYPESRFYYLGFRVVLR